jgi:hypothetical protein
MENRRNRQVRYSKSRFSCLISLRPRSSPTIRITEKQGLKARGLIEKASLGWDQYGIAMHQIELLESGQVNSEEELKTKTEEYEGGPEILKDFLDWVRTIFAPEEEIVEDKVSRS